MAPIESPELGVKSKKEKKDKSAKKRAREEEAPADAERKHKKSKSIVDATDLPNGDVTADKKEKKKKKKKDKHASEDVVEEEPSEKKEKKHKKKKHHHDETNGDAPAASQDLGLEPVAAAVEDLSLKKKKSKATDDAGEATEEPSEAVDKKEKKKKKSKKHHDTNDTIIEASQEQEEVVPATDPMEIDSTAPSKPSGKIHQPPDIPPNPQFPFFNQTVSLYEPLYPTGWDKPITGCESQHLRHLRNRYVPSLRGVLLDYSKVSLGQKPGRAGAATSDEHHTTLISKTEFGGGFGWLTAEVKLFVPTRGAWMEGAVNLQTEGHIGVVCFGKFNASVEARRLPPSWKWVPNDQAEGGFEETASVITAPDEHGVVRQLHSTGHWVDASGEKIKGRIRFRIRNFDVGVSGDSTYLSLQGTMLESKSEKKLVETEAREARDRKARKGGRGGGGGRERRFLPDFSMTTFTNEEDESTQVQQDADEVRDALANEE